MSPQRLLLLLLLLCAATPVAAQSVDSPTMTVTPTTSPSSTDAPPATPPSPTVTPPATTVPTAPAITPESAQPQQAATATVAPPAGLRLDVSKTLIGSDVVRVGQVLTFTITIVNSGAITVTTLPLVDAFDPAILQPQFAGFSRQPDTIDPGVLTWADLTVGTADLAPGQRITLVTTFRAIRISDEVINRARVVGAQGSDGAGGAPAAGSGGGRAEGGRVIVEKALVPGLIRLDAPVITFTITLRNDGAADIVSAPLDDTYRTDLLRFRSGQPPPSSHDPATGRLRWNDLLAALGQPRLRPGETIRFTTSYTVTGDIDDAVVNSADAVDVRDEFGNAVVSPRRAEVRIRIIGVGAQPPTVTVTATRQRPRNTPEPGATGTPLSSTTPDMPPAAPATLETPAVPDASPVPGAMPAATPTATSAAVAETPRTLPQTSDETTSRWLLALAGLLLIVGLAVRRGVRR